MARLTIRFSPKFEKKSVTDQRATVAAALAWGGLHGPQIVRDAIRSTHPFQSRTGKAANLWGSYVSAGELKIFSQVPYARFLNYGWQGGPMWWLAGKTVPLFGGLIYRRVTRKALEQGHWYRPFRAPTFFFEHAMETLVEQLQEQFPELAFTLELCPFL